MLGLLVGQLREQVGGVVGAHGLEHVGRPLVFQRGEQLHLLVLGKFLQHVGEAVVVEGGGHLVPALAGKAVQHLREVGGAQLLEGGQQARRPLHLLGQRQALHLVPVDRAHLGPAPPPFPDGDVGEKPVMTARLLHGRIDDRHRLLAVPAAARHPDLPVEQLAEDEHLPRPLFEPPPVQRPAAEHHGTGVDGRHPAHRHEDPAPLHLDDEAEHPRRLPAQPQGHHDVADAPQQIPVGVEHADARQARAKDPRGCLRGLASGDGAAGGATAGRRHAARLPPPDFRGLCRSV